MRRWVIVPVALLMALGGCLGGDKGTVGSEAAEETSPASQEPGAGPGRGNASTPAQPAAPREIWHNGTIQVNAPDNVVQGDAKAYEFQPGAKWGKVSLDVTFSSPDGAQDIDALLTAPSIECHPGAVCGYAAQTPPDGWYHNRNGSVGSPDSPSRVDVGGDGLGSNAMCASCTWLAWVYSREPVGAEVTFSLKITIWPAVGA